jgi:exosome complex RNA-binding protein Csl4
VKGTPIQVLNCKNNLSLENLHHKWVSIQGVFDKGNKGHMGSFAGSITKISQIRDIFIKDFNKRMEIDSLRNKDISKMKSENEKPNTIKKK